MNAEQLKTLQWLVDGNGDITIGTVGPCRYAATACDEDSMLASLIHRDGESLLDLLYRLENAVNLAYDEEIYIDEINNGPNFQL